MRIGGLVSYCIGTVGILFTDILTMILPAHVEIEMLSVSVIARDYCRRYAAQICYISQR
mgnify:CR=1 FL=1